MDEQEKAYWLADKIPAYGDYAKEAADLLRRQADELRIGKEMLGRMMAEYGVLRDENERLRKTEKFLRSERPLARKLTSIEAENVRLRQTLETYACMSEAMSRPAREALKTHNLNSTTPNVAITGD